MAIDLQKFTKGKNFSGDFVLDDPSDKILVATATDTVQGKVALNNGTTLPADASNAMDALTAGGAATILNSAPANPLKAAVVLTSPTVATYPDCSKVDVAPR